MMKLASAVLVAVAFAATVASAQQPVPGTILTTVPADAMTVTHWYKQNVYDAGDNKIGEIMDVLVDRDGKVNALIVGVGGFLGVGEKDVAVQFGAVQFKTKDNNKWYGVMNTTKDALKSAPGLKYDRTAMTWMLDAATTGAPTAR